MNDRNSLRQLQDQIERKMQIDAVADREREDSLYMAPAEPQLRVGRLANVAEFGGTSGTVRPGEPVGTSDSYSEQLVQRRDSEAANRMPRSARAWEAEQNRPGSWQSGVGNMQPIGYGRSQTIGVGRPLFKQGRDT